MSGPNGSGSTTDRVNRFTSESVTEAAAAAEAPAEAGAIDALPGPPDLRLPAGVTRKLAILLTVLPLGLWVLLAIPRAMEITGAAEGGGGEGGESLFVGGMLALISIVISLLAVVVTTLSHSEIEARIAIEHEETEILKIVSDDAEEKAVETAQERNRAYGATDARVGAYADQLRAIEARFWEDFFIRHAENPQVYGTYEDAAAVKQRFSETYGDLFQPAAMLTPDELGTLVEHKRRDRATFDDTRVSRRD